MAEDFPDDGWQELPGDEASFEEAGDRREKTIRLAESDDLEGELAKAWQRWRNAQAHRRDAEVVEEEAGQAALELEEALVAAAIAWLSEQWGTHKPCPYCGNAEWTVGIPVRWAGPEPVFPVTCNKCANTVLINAIQAGVLAEDDVEDL